MVNKIFENYNIILASQSPRRQQLLKELGLDFTVKVIDGIEEYFDTNLKSYEIPMFLAKQKASFYTKILDEKTILITADTIVWLDDEVLPKPANYKEAFKILKKLSGKKHEVITGICLSSKTKQDCFYSRTEVFFKELSNEEINYYIENYKPYDKAGAYGIQEWIGYVGITKIKGSYFNVVGLPVQKLFSKLCKFVRK